MGSVLADAPLSIRLELPQCGTGDVLVQTAIARLSDGHCPACGERMQVRDGYGVCRRTQGTGWRIEGRGGQVNVSVVSLAVV